MLLHEWYCTCCKTKPSLLVLLPAAKLGAVGFGIRKMQITAIIEDAKIESLDAITEEELVRDGESETIQSFDVASFNKLQKDHQGAGCVKCNLLVIDCRAFRQVARGKQCNPVIVNTCHLTRFLA